MVAFVVWSYGMVVLVIGQLQVAIFVVLTCDLGNLS